MIFVLEDVELGGAVSPVWRMALSRDSAVDQDNLHEDGLLAQVTQGLDVVTDVAPQPPGPALLEQVLEGGVLRVVGDVGEGVVGAELRLVTDTAPFCLEELTDLPKINYI